MNTSINQDAKVVANLQRCEIPSKNPKDIPDIDQDYFNLNFKSLIFLILFALPSLHFPSCFYLISVEVVLLVFAIAKDLHFITLHYPTHD